MARVFGETCSVVAPGGSPRGLPSSMVSEAFGPAALLTRKEPPGVLYGEYPGLRAGEAAGFDLLTFPTNPKGLARIK